MSVCVLVSLTRRDRNAKQVIDESEHKVNPDSPHGLFRQLNAGHNVQQIILNQKKKIL